MRAILTVTIALVLLAPAALPARAQTISAPIVTVVQDRLFSESRFGQRVQRDHEARVQALSQENRQIEAALIEEERSLTDQRVKLPAEEFRSLADAFDDKVQRIRAEQDAKANALGQLLDKDRQAFLSLTGPLLRTLVIERGAVALLDRRVVILAADSIDITGAAIARIDSRIGDGTSGESALPTDGPSDGSETQPAPRPQLDDINAPTEEPLSPSTSIELDSATDSEKPPTPQPTE